MNYRHVYHAGGFSDVIKHVFLTAIVFSFERKEAPFCYIDTHAGMGAYDLYSNQAEKSKEYVGGIQKVLEAEHPPYVIKRYLDCVHQINNQLSGSKFASLQYYPGSPLIVRHFMRSHDRIVACELESETYQALKSNFLNDRQVDVHHTDGFLGLKAFLPPKERRGFVLIDPPYEDPDEFMRIARTLPLALKRWERGTYAIWYPIKEKATLARFYRVLEQTINEPILVCELTIYPDLPKHLNGCGLAIINPPWQLEQTANELVPWLWKALTINGQGEYSVHHLK